MPRFTKSTQNRHLYVPPTFTLVFLQERRKLIHSSDTVRFIDRQSKVFESLFSFPPQGFQLCSQARTPNSETIITKVFDHPSVIHVWEHQQVIVPVILLEILYPFDAFQSHSNHQLTTVTKGRFPV